MSLETFLAKLIDNRKNLPNSNPNDYAIGAKRIGNDRKLYIVVRFKGNKIWRLFSKNCTIIPKN